jgi:transketolase
MFLDERSKQLRRDAIDLSLANGGYHYGGTFSTAEILKHLFDDIMGEKDRFILSKGHGCWIYYVLLREQGFDPVLEGHPEFDPHNGIFCTAGSMGHGLPTALGQAQARKLKGQEGKVFVLIGDGEAQEGTTWESILIGGHLRLDNLVVIMDSNNIQGSGYVNDIMPVKTPLMGAANLAGWSVVELYGHDESLTEVDFDKQKRPMLIVANTVKGAGVSFMENKPKWHSNWLGGEELKQAREELK